jgi:hypothetical protein
MTKGSYLLQMKNCLVCKKPKYFAKLKKTEIPSLIFSRHCSYSKYCSNLHYKCEVAKLGTAATGKFLSGKRERERAPVQRCQIKQDFRVAKKALTFIKV